ncbi:MAG: DNA alkylation repair protein [Acidimicrobiales bacterium]
MFGVSYASHAGLKKRLGTDHELARALWATGNHDARVLATKVADPARLTAREADAWMRSCDNYVIVEGLAPVVARSPVAAGRAKAWRDRKDEWPASAGWAVTTLLVPDMPAEDALALLAQIEGEIHGRPNRVRHEMNATLIAIGVRDEPELQAEAKRAAAAIGPIHVDHGQTGCKTPYPIPYIDKALEQGAAKARKKAGT